MSKAAVRKRGTRAVSVSVAVAVWLAGLGPVVGLGSEVRAETPEAPVDVATEATPEHVKEPSTRPATRPVSRTIELAGKTLRYTVAPDFITVRNDEGKPQAKFFHIAYTLDGEPASDRPVTFVFNGGPGSSSVWLHLGTAGPRHVEVGDDALPPPGPGRLVDNVDTWLPASDLVFVDPIGTGYSRAEPGVDGKKYWSVEGDVSSIGEFIRLYLTKHKRWASPKYLAGESYGTTRAAALSNHLSRALGIDVSGIVLISSVLEFATIRGGEGNDLPYQLFLPSYTGVAYYHKKLAPALQGRALPDVLKEVEAFSEGEYATALAKGAALAPADADRLARQLSAYTGLPEEYIRRNRLRIESFRFMKELLAGEQKIVGRFDGTITAYDTDPAAAEPDFDPSYTRYQGAYTSAMNHYLVADLGFVQDMKYEIIAGLPWTYPQGSYVNTATALAEAMTTNPNLRVLVLSGYQDLATPYFATEYTLRRLNIPPEARDRILSKHYFGGHMMYHHAQSRSQVGDDVREFLK